MYAAKNPVWYSGTDRTTQEVYAPERIQSTRLNAICAKAIWGRAISTLVSQPDTHVRDPIGFWRTAKTVNPNLTEKTKFLKSIKT